MEFVKYQHLEKYGTDEVHGIDIGECYIFPKIDGTNGQLCVDEFGSLCAGSRNRELSLDNDNAGFFNWAVEQENIKQFFRANPKIKLYGEWLVPHTLRTYRDDAWKRFYVFDVISEDGYMHYEEYKVLLEKFNIDYIPPIAKITNPTIERLMYFLGTNNYLIEDGKGSGEGIAIKNYNYRNKYGRITWAKLVKNEFKERHQSNKTTEVKEKKLVEEEIANKYVTETLVEKEYSKIVNESGWTSKQIPRLLNTVYYCLVKEDCWEFVKEHKNPTIDFKKLAWFSNEMVKKIKGELF